jgi:septal ring factor EnvC (AmiA/AmiB activator)
MKKIDSVLGQWLLAGEPIGKMVSLGDSKEKTHPLLYLEIRYKGQPINPLPWLVVRNIKLDKDKVNG